MTKDKAVLNAAYQAASNQIIEQLEQGKDVACLTLGDPTIYSTYIYIHRIVKAHGYATEIINGIPSFCAVSRTVLLTAQNSFILFRPLMILRRRWNFQVPRF